MEIDWFLPTGGDARDVLPSVGSAHRPPTLRYLAQVAMAGDELGFDAVLTPCGTGCEDAWMATSALIPLTRRLKFLVAFRPALLTPTLAAQMASTYQRLSEGRLMINIVTGAEPAELARFGVWEDKDTRYQRTAEFIEVMRAAWSAMPADYDGTFFSVQGATTREMPDPVPPIYLRGGAGTALVGSYEEIADRIVEYHRLGFDAFIFSSYPHLEEAYWFGEGVLPILRQRGHLAPLPQAGAQVFSFR